MISLIGGLIMHYAKLAKDDPLIRPDRMSRLLFLVVILLILIACISFVCLPSSARWEVIGALVLAIVSGGGIVRLLEAFGVEVFAEKKEKVR